MHISGESKSSKEGLPSHSKDEPWLWQIPSVHWVQFLSGSEIISTNNETDFFRKLRIPALSFPHLPDSSISWKAQSVPSPSPSWETRRIPLDWSSIWIKSTTKALSRSPNGGLESKVYWKVLLYSQICVVPLKYNIWERKADCLYFLFHRVFPPEWSSACLWITFNLCLFSLL